METLITWVLLVNGLYCWCSFLPKLSLTLPVELRSTHWKWTGCNVAWSLWSIIEEMMMCCIALALWRKEWVQAPIGFWLLKPWANLRCGSASTMNLTPSWNYLQSTTFVIPAIASFWGVTTPHALWKNLVVTVFNQLQIQGIARNIQMRMNFSAWLVKSFAAYPLTKRMAARGKPKPRPNLSLNMIPRVRVCLLQGVTRLY